MHVLIFPTAVRIETQNSAYQFTSFRSRSNTYDQLVRILNNFKKKNLENQSNSSQANGVSLEQENSLKTDNINNENPSRSIQSSDIWSEDDDLNEFDDKDHDLTTELLSITDEETNVDLILDGYSTTPVTTYFNNFIAYDQYKKQQSSSSIKELNKNSSSVPFINSNKCYKY